jgi:hypothetical protein
MASFSVMVDHDLTYLPATLGRTASPWKVIPQQ